MNQGFDMTEFTIQPTEQPNEIKHFICMCNEDQVKRNLLKILKSIEIQQFFVFVAKEEDANEYSEMLTKAGYIAGTLTSCMTPEERDDTIEKFRYGEIKALVTTNAFSRGLCIPDVTHVFSIDLPGKESMCGVTDIESYIHSSGRAGRFGCGGVSFTFVKDVRDLRAIRSISSKTQIKFHQIDSDELKSISLDKKEENELMPQEEKNVLSNLLAQAAGDGEIAVVKYLIEKKNISVENTHCSPLASAVANNKIDIVKYLLEKGADVNVRDENGNYPLHCAKNKEMQVLLIEHGANIIAQNDFGEVPISNQAFYEELAELGKKLFLEKYAK